MVVIPDEKKVQKSFRNGSCMGPKKVVLIGIYFFTIKLPNAHPHFKWPFFQIQPQWRSIQVLKKLEEDSLFS